MTTTTPDLDAIEALSERWQREPRGTCLDVPARTLAESVPTLIARMRELESENARLRGEDNDELSPSEMELVIIRSDRNRLLKNIERLTGIRADMIAPSGIALDEELEGWLDRLVRQFGYSARPYWKDSEQTWIWRFSKIANDHVTEAGETVATETTLDDYVDCPCCGGVLNLSGIAVCGCCEGTGAVHKDTDAANEREYAAAAREPERDAANEREYAALDDAWRRLTQAVDEYETNAKADDGDGR